jgi:hypothetical protein
VSWTSDNFLGNRSVTQQGVEFSSANAGSVYRNVNPINNLFRLDDTGSLFYRTSTADAVCQTGSVWVVATTTCIETPNLTITAEGLIRRGDVSNMEIEITSDYAVECSMNDGTNHVFTVGVPPTTRTHSIDTRELPSTQIVTIECHHVNYPVVSTTESVRVEVIPEVQEI